MGKGQGQRKSYLSQVSPIETSCAVFNACLVNSPVPQSLTDHAPQQAHTSLATHQVSETFQYYWPDSFQLSTKPAALWEPVNFTPFPG